MLIYCQFCTYVKTSNDNIFRHRINEVTFAYTKLMLPNKCDYCYKLKSSLLQSMRLAQWKRGSNKYPVSVILYRVPFPTTLRSLLGVPCCFMHNFTAEYQALLCVLFTMLFQTFCAEFRSTHRTLWTRTRTCASLEEMRPNRTLGPGRSPSKTTVRLFTMIRQLEKQVQIYWERDRRLIKYNRKYMSGTVNSKSFISKDFLQIEWKFELNYTL